MPRTKVSCNRDIHSSRRVNAAKVARKFAIKKARHKNPTINPGEGRKEKRFRPGECFGGQLINQQSINTPIVFDPGYIILFPAKSYANPKKWQKKIITQAIKKYQMEMLKKYQIKMQ